MTRTLLCLLAGLGLGGPCAGDARAQPNVVVVMMDDLSVDALNAAVAGGLMPALETRVMARGTTFTNAFVTNPLCCPSRATYLTGQYTHNHRVYSNTNQTFEGGIGWPGWFPAGEDPGLEARALPVWLQNAGYHTAHIGKYLNGYGLQAPAGVATPRTYVPPGWDDWRALLDPTTYRVFDYELNDNGSVTQYGSADADYQTDVLAAHAVDYVLSRADTGQPFFLNIAPLAPHVETIAPTTPGLPFDYRLQFALTIRPAPRHAALTDGDPDNGEAPALVAKASFDESDVSDKASCPRPDPPPERVVVYEPLCVADLPALDPGIHVPLVEAQYKDMLASLAAADELLGAVLDALETIGALDDTVILFTSDNGWFYGEHRLSDKSLPYDEAARVPLIVAGPMTVPGTQAAQLVVNNDFAPTIAELAGAVPELTVDGTSFVPLLLDPGADWFRRTVLLENLFFPSRRKFRFASSFSLRGIRPGLSFLFTDVYAQPGNWSTPTDYEFYNLGNDPHALSSIALTATPLSQLRVRLSQLRGCAGAQCRTIEGE